MTNGNDAAFARPCSIDTRQGTLPDGDDLIPETNGLTKRELFASMALQGILSDPDACGDRQTLTLLAVAYADDLIDALKTATEPTR